MAGGNSLALRGCEGGLALKAVRPRGVAVGELSPVVRRDMVAFTLTEPGQFPAVDMRPGRLRRAAPRDPRRVEGAPL